MMGIHFPLRSFLSLRCKSYQKTFAKCGKEPSTVSLMIQQFRWIKLEKLLEYVQQLVILKWHSQKFRHFFHFSPTLLFSFVFVSRVHFLHCCQEKYLHLNRWRKKKRKHKAELGQFSISISSGIVKKMVLFECTISFRFVVLIDKINYIYYIDIKKILMTLAWNVPCQWGTRTFRSQSLPPMKQDAFLMISFYIQECWITLSHIQ